MARQIQLTQAQIVKVLEAMHDICVFVDLDEALTIKCSLCNHNIFVGFEGENPDTGEEIYKNDLGADELFIRAGEHCLPDASGVSECDSMQVMGVDIDVLASQAGIDLEGND